LNLPCKAPFREQVRKRRANGGHREEEEFTTKNTTQKEYKTLQHPIADQTVTQWVFYLVPISTIKKRKNTWYSPCKVYQMQQSRPKHQSRPKFYFGSLFSRRSPKTL
jgi:hypothetical protein